jgi:hypothetical protein
VRHDSDHTYKVIEPPKDTSTKLCANPYLHSSTSNSQCDPDRSTSCGSNNRQNWSRAHTATARHNNVVCDHCNRRIVGVRYKVHSS